MARLHGGTDADDWKEYEEEEESNYSTKGSHRLRSVFWSPRHAEHWKKEEKKQ